MKNTKSMSFILWTARIIGTLIVVITLIFAIGSFFEGRNKPGPGLDTSTIRGFVVWGVGLFGLVLAIWKPGTGGVISLLSFIVFNMLVALSPNPEVRYSFVLLIFLFPSILYLLFWWLKKSSSSIS